MDEFREMLKEAYERGCPFCGASGDMLCATRTAVHETECNVMPDGRLAETRTDETVGAFVAEVRCRKCSEGIYVNGEWI